MRKVGTTLPIPASWKAPSQREGLKGNGDPYWRSPGVLISQ